MKKSIATVVAFLVSACGGGEEGGFDFIPLPTYGSIAINKQNGRAAITANYASQKEANREAISTCGIDCEIAMEFGSNLCGALARAGNEPTFGWASDTRLSDAKSKALNQCSQSGGKQCSVVLDKCNSS
jgi:hypothetical protein